MSAVNIDIKASALELASLFRQHPEGINQSDFDQGKSFLGKFVNEKIDLETPENSALVKLVLLNSIEDLSLGGKKLTTGHIGLVLNDEKIQYFESAYQSLPVGSICYSIFIKHLVLQARRSVTGDELGQDKINCGIYYLTHLLAKYV